MAGLLSLNPSISGNAQEQILSLDFGNDHHKVYPNKNDKNSNGQKITCFNNNLNLNGIDITKIPLHDLSKNVLNGAEEQVQQDRFDANRLEDTVNVEKNLVNVCVNVNENDQLRGVQP